MSDMVYRFNRNDGEFARSIIPAYSPRYGAFIIEIRFNKNKQLSIQGVYAGSAGQIVDELSSDELIPISPYTEQDLIKIASIWERWHLNDMMPGGPKQMEFIRNLPRGTTFTRMSRALESAGLLYEDGIKFGAKWRREEVPDEVLKYLFSLPCANERSDSYADLVTNSKGEINKDDFLNLLITG